jgi:hypothetical protein
MLVLVLGASVLAKLRLVEAELATLALSRLQLEDFERAVFSDLNWAWHKVLAGVATLKLPTLVSLIFFTYLPVIVVISISSLFKTYIVGADQDVLCECERLHE